MSTTSLHLVTLASSLTVTVSNLTSVIPRPEMDKQAVVVLFDQRCGPPLTILSSAQLLSSRSLLNTDHHLCVCRGLHSLITSQVANVDITAANRSKQDWNDHEHSCKEGEPTRGKKQIIQQEKHEYKTLLL